MKKIICFGEILWDEFPTGKLVGGAPLNVALRMQSLGANSTIISRRGKDENGKEICEFIKERGLNTKLIQLDEKYPTGLVKVNLDDKGLPSYNIVYPSAWDKIEVNPQSLKAAGGSDAFIFGSLACRDTVSHNTLLQLLKQASYKVFDVNLRPPNYEMRVVEDLMQKANFIKLNDEELCEISEKIGSPYHSMEQNIRYLSDKTNVAEICVTKGRHGAVYFTDKKFYYHSGFKVKVIDTVGAGDSFLAALLFKLLHNETPDKALEYASAMGALVASQKGATSNIAESIILRFINP